MNTERTVHILGAGFAGLQAARAVLHKDRSAGVTIVSAVPYATMLPALPDILTRRVPPGAIIRDLKEIFSRYGERVSVVVAEITEIDLEQRTLRDTLHTEYPWQTLIIATGSTPEYYGFSQTKNLQQLDTMENAEALRQEFHHRDGTAVLVVGGGYTGLEVAAGLRVGEEKHPPITVVDVADHILPFLPERRRQAILRYLDAMDITVRSGVALQEYDGTTAILSDGSKIENVLVCWAAGMRGTRTEIRGTVGKTRDHRLHVASDLTLPGYPQVFVAGDAAALERDGQVLRRAVNFAFYSGRHAGRNVVRLWRGRARKPFRPVDLGWVIPLGRKSLGTVFGVLPVGGRLGLRLHYLMCGFRHFGVTQTLQFYWTALRLRRRVD